MKSVPFHVMIWPSSSRQQPLRELYAFNLDEATLRTRFIEPYERGESITWDGRTLPAGDVSYIRIGQTDVPYRDEVLRARSFYYEAFKATSDVTNNWIVGAAGSMAADSAPPREALALTRTINVCKRFDAVTRQLRRRHASRPTLEISDEYDVQDLMHALLLLDFEDVRAESWNPTYLGAHRESTSYCRMRRSSSRSRRRARA